MIGGGGSHCGGRKAHGTLVALSVTPIVGPIVPISRLEIAQIRKSGLTVMQISHTILDQWYLS